MANDGWMINLGDAVTVYSMKGNGASTGNKIGKITKNECFAYGANIGAGWEGVDYPVWFLNAQHVGTIGVVPNDVYIDSVDFSKYASNGTSWVKVDTLERKVQYATNAYYSNGDWLCELLPGSRVWLTRNGTHGQENYHYIAVTKVQEANGDVHEFDGNGFIDLVAGNWLNVGSILLRKV